MNIVVHLSLMAITGLIIFRTVKHAGLVLYSLHPVFLSVGVSSALQVFSFPYRSPLYIL